MPSYRPSELRRRSVAQSIMRTDAIVVLPPRFCHGSGLVERLEPMLVQALIVKPAVEPIDHCVIRGLSWPAEVELHAVEVGPQIQAPRDEFWAVVDSNACRLSTLGSHVLQDPNHVVSGQPLADLDGPFLQLTPAIYRNNVALTSAFAEDRWIWSGCRTRLDLV